MRSGTSFFNGTIYRKNLCRFWPLWGAALVFWGLVMPVNGLMRLRSSLEYTSGEYSPLRSFAMHIGGNAVEIGLVFALVAALITAMAMFSHLYSPRSANFMGALPVRREGLFLSHYLAGLTSLLAPNVIIFLLTLLVEAAGRQLYLFPLAFWLAAISAMEFFFYSFAVCLGMFTGHLLALPVYYGVFNAMAVAVYLLINGIMEAFYYGFNGFDSAVETGVMWCTPVAVFASMDCSVLYENDVLIQRTEGMNCTWIYAIAAVVFTVAALLLYRRRRMESAGDVVSVKAMRPVFKYGVGACVGLFFGLVTTAILGLGEPGLMVAVVLWGIVGYFVAQMLLDKSFRVFGRWKGAAALTAAFLLLFGVIAFDLTGYETRVPAADEVAEVQIRGLSNGQYDDGCYVNAAVTDPEQVEKIIALHRAAVDRHVTGENSADAGTGTGWGFTLSYTLDSGMVMERRYDVWDVAENAGRPGTVWYAIDRLIADRDFMWEVYGFARAEEYVAQGAELDYAQVEWIDQQWIDKADPQNIKTLHRSDAQALYELVSRDFEAGRVGRTDGEGCWDVAATITFCWRVPEEVRRDEYSFFAEPYADYAIPETASTDFYVSINVEREAESTLAAIQGLIN